MNVANELELQIMMMNLISSHHNVMFMYPIYGLATRHYNEFQSCLAKQPKRQYTELILGLRPANERRRYEVTPSLIGWAQT